MQARFTLLNIQGLVTKFTNKLHSQELQAVFSHNDFVLLVETWAGEFTDISVPGFNLIQLNRVEKKRTAKRDSGGIALYIRQSFYRYCTLFAKDSDDIIWIKIKGQLFNLPHDLYLCLCYIIPVSSSRAALVEMDVFDRISNYIIKIANDTNDCYNILICGDLNSRVGNEKDYVVFDNDANIIILPIDYNIDVHIPRFSQDSIVNTNGRKLLDFCKLNSLRIANGRMGSDRGVGQYTYVGSTGRSVVDYLLINSYLFDLICDFHVGDPNILSDHCTIGFSLQCKNFLETESSEEQVTFETVDRKYVWRDERADEYIFQLGEQENGLRDATYIISRNRR